MYKQRSTNGHPLRLCIISFCLVLRVVEGSYACTRMITSDLPSWGVSSETFLIANNPRSALVVQTQSSTNQQAFLCGDQGDHLAITILQNL